MAVKNLLKYRVKLYTRFIKERKVSPDGPYKTDLDKTKELLKVIEAGKLTPAKFDKLSTRDKWDIERSKLLKNIQWCCNRCGSAQDPSSMAPFMDGEYIACSECDNELTRRTPGGQCNPFNMTFKKIK